MPSDERYGGAWKGSALLVPSLSSEWLETANSPYINRFLQPDSIVPNPANPQSWNRYSYVTNRPIKFRDPSGHKYCEGDFESQNDCEYSRTESASLKADLSQRFGIKITGKMSDSQLRTLYDGASLYDDALANSCIVAGVGVEKCLGFGRGDLFELVFNHINLVFTTDDDGGWGGVWDDDRDQMNLHGGNFPIELILHEFSHILDTRAGDAPSNLLDSSSIVTRFGEFVSGFRDGSYDRTELGLVIAWGDDYTTGYGSVYTQLHRRRWEGGNSGGEEFADMFMNYAMGTFAHDDYGIARNEWMMQNLPNFIALAVNNQ